MCNNMKLHNNSADQVLCSDGTQADHDVQLTRLLPRQSVTWLKGDISQMQPFKCLEDTWVFPTGHFVKTLKQEQLEEKRTITDGTQGRWAQQDCTHHLWGGTRCRLCLGCWKWFWLCKDQELAGTHSFKTLSTYLLHHHIFDRFGKFLYHVCTLKPNSCV